MKDIFSDSSDASDTLVALGANLADAGGTRPYQLCLRAIQAIGDLEGVRLISRSPFYRSAAMPAGSGPDYVNGCVRLACALSPERLLAALQAIEQRLGRVRSVANAPRTMDLDIIAMGALVRAAPDPVLPHPRAHLRAFVLRPIQDVWPGWRHPVLGPSVEALLARLPLQDIAILVSDAHPG